MKRGAVTKQNSRLLNLWVPIDLLPALDQGVRIIDSDRSKFVRIAVREKLESLGITIAAPDSSS